ncbi:hypothetical protein CkaCkLH20_03655 [Colletotrichum karsti]|uniref:Uncharacterized protein n=1 Tax=Colletotrichum karsti TaxID=1095194 RepID=A0A9P6IH19_9PEZI|nr:uncharacterized protein CkaCkLH20_03655 [Colletotrichum karsti]KAF9878755.1 hypothetical protein CkaCkLH20_03655 [Colletotrichum karsti]
MGSSSSKQKHATWGPGGNPTKAQQPGGFPPANSLAVSSVTHTGTAPKWCDKGSSQHNDFYRNNTQHLRQNGALDSQRMPPTSPFRQQYEAGKDLDQLAQDLDNKVKAHGKTKDPVVAKKQKKLGNPDYGGQPLESRQWHNGAADLLDESGRTWKAAGIERQKTAQNFIGYDSLQGHHGHQKRIAKCNQSAEKRAEKAEYHRKQVP